MLGLTLREEFQGRRLKGTAIELANDNNTGATQINAAEFLSITYPTADVLAALEAIGPGHGQPVVLIGERGQGKSHLLAALYHGFTSPDVTSNWLADWGVRLGEPRLAQIKLRPKTHVISESLHRQNYKFLWDLLFDHHPHGSYVRGKWEAQGDKRTDIPGDKLLLELFRHTPTALVLDEFQTWYDSLTHTKQAPWRAWAFNFIQLLSEIAKEHPELLVLVVSVRNGESEAYQQIHRVNPRQIDFKGLNARRDRLRLLLHRLFDNRMQVPEAQIAIAIAAHVSEHLRLADVAPSEHDRVQKDFVAAWPFAPHLMTLLEDQVLVATQAQETRDLIRILADVFKSHNPGSPIITAADFRLDDDKSGIAALLDSVSNQHHANLRERAQRNLTAVVDAVKSPEQNIPHLTDIVGALWLRSLAIKHAGAERAELQVDITRAIPIDDNAFQAELSTIVENSFNIHEDGSRLVFREEENPQAKLLASARNDKLFVDDSDKQRLAREVRYVIGGSETAGTAFKVVVLAANWTAEPWTGVDESDQPAQWDERIPLLVVPEPPDKVEARLGAWLKAHLQTRRNAVRFLLPRAGAENLFYERDLQVLARAVHLAEKWKAQNPEYRKLHAKYEAELRGILKRRFDRFAILATWDFQNPAQCTFQVESHGAEGAQIPEVVDGLVTNNLFVPEDFDARVLEAARQSESVGKLLRELQELFLATAGWDLWRSYEAVVPRTAEALVKWWAARDPGRAVLVLDAMSLREAPWLLAGAAERGYTVHQARATGAELPADTTPFAQALGFSHRGALQNNGGAGKGRLSGAATDSTNLPWDDCAAQINSAQDWLLWHDWPDEHLHDLSGLGHGLAALAREAAEKLRGDGFWILVHRLTTGRRLIITADHGYAASGLFPDTPDAAQARYLKDRFKSGRWAALADLADPAPGTWVPPLDLHLKTDHAEAAFALGRRKWKSPGGYPTLTHGGFSLLEVAVPFVELSRSGGA